MGLNLPRSGLVQQHHAPGSPPHNHFLDPVFMRPGDGERYTDTALRTKLTSLVE